MAEVRRGVSTGTYPLAEVVDERVLVVLGGESVNRVSHSLETSILQAVSTERDVVGGFSQDYVPRFPW